MTNQTRILSRTGLNEHQIKALQGVLDAKARGKIIDVPEGQAYEVDLEILASVGEGLTKRFTEHFLPESWPVHFLLLDSEIKNAYAYWMRSFEAICMTTSLAREIDELCDDVASYLVQHSGVGSGFAYLHEVALSPEVKHGSLKALFVQGVMAFFVGHEVGHLSAGHKPVLTSTTAAASLGDEQQGDMELFVDYFFAAATSQLEMPSVHSLRLNAHEVDADVQGFALTSAFWLDLADRTRSDRYLPIEAELIRAACSRPDRMLLLACTGAAIAMSLMGYKEFTGDWSRQATHPLTAVRCVVGLATLANLLMANRLESVTLQLRPECIEALSVVHSRLGSRLLKAARSEGKYSQVAKMLKEALPDDRLSLMFRVTGVAQAIAMSNELVKYLAELSAEFDACMLQREKATTVPTSTLARWSAVVEHQ